MQKDARLIVKVGIESFKGKEEVQFTVEDIKSAGN